jgi:sugar lactone lactonase YvrE
MLRRHIIGGALMVAVAACTKGETGGAAKAGTDTSAGLAPTAVKVGETAEMRTPESVRYDPELDVYYVSNINGNPSQHDGNGFISVVRADSTGVVRVLAQSGKNGVTLNAPKGIAIVGDTLWVADIDVVRAFNRRTGAPIATIDLRPRKATFLNDVAVAPTGEIYVTDSGILFDSAGGLTHPGVDRIFKIAGRTVTEPVTGDALAAPNGITWDAPNSRWLIAPFSGTNVMSWREGEAHTTTIASGPGQYDGIEVLADGRILVTSWADSAVHVIQPGSSSMQALVRNVSAPADIGVDTRRNLVAIPRFNDNKVEYYTIP